MSATAPLMTRDDIAKLIAEKAWKDQAFHRAVLVDANKALEQQVGQPVPAGITFKVLEDSANTIHIVIPAKPANAGELLDSELEGVAGGRAFMGNFITTISTAASPFFQLLGKAFGG